MSTNTDKILADPEPTIVFNQGETLFRALIENSLDAIALVSHDGLFSYLSPSVQKMLGFTPEELLGRKSILLFPPDQLASARAQFATVASTPGLTATIEHPCLHKNGSLRWLETTVANHLDDPDIHAFVANFRDITLRKQTEEKQRLLNEVSDMFVSSLDHAVTLKEIAALLVPSLADYCRIAMIDEKGQIKEIIANHIEPEKIALVGELYEQYKDRANTTHGLQKLLQTGKAELISIISQGVLAPVQDNPELVSIVHTLGLQSYMGVPLLVRGRTLGAMTFSSTQPNRHYTPDDLLFAKELARRIAFVLENARLYREAQDEIAERRQAEAKLRQSEQRYRLVVEHTTDLITLLDMEGTILFISPTCETLLGYRHEEMLGKQVLSFNHPDDLPYIETQFANIFQGDIASFPSYRTRHKAGHWVILAGTGSAITDEQGRPFLIVITSHDITQQQELEQRKDHFISMASHELKTPVTSIKGFTQLLYRHFQKREDEKSLLYLAKMDTQLNKLTKLINDLLDISKMQAGKLTYQEEWFDLDAFVQEVIENVQQTTQTHQLVLNGTTHVQVRGDQDRLGQVLMNLLSNAIKYSPDADMVIIRVSIEQENAIVSVQDFGIGIAESHHQKIFERFYQVSDPVEKTFPGLGIGLYISAEIINRHHGRLWVESRKGVGSTFCFSIPLVESKQIPSHL